MNFPIKVQLAASLQFANKVVNTIIEKPLIAQYNARKCT